MIKGKNKLRCGLIGKTLSHSFSPEIHSCLADYSYKLFEMSECEVGKFIRGDSYDAANVTIPYKKTRALSSFYVFYSKHSAYFGFLRIPSTTFL